MAVVRGRHTVDDGILLVPAIHIAFIFMGISLPVLIERIDVLINQEHERNQTD